MKYLITLLAILTFGGLLGILIQKTPGYALLSWSDFSVEMSLWTLLFFGLLVYLAINLVLRFLGLFLGLPASVKRWSQNKRQFNTYKAILRGVEDLFAGQWKSAYTQLNKTIKASETPLVNLIGGAQAAEQLGRYQERDQLLTQAEQQGQRGQLLAALERAQNCLHQSDHQEAEQWLRKASQLNPKHPRVILLRQSLDKVSLTS